MNSLNLVLFLVSFMCCYAIVKSTRKMNYLFDQIDNLSQKCKNKARDNSIRCELEACNRIDCIECDCEYPTLKVMCDEMWDGGCCIKNLFEKWCSEKDVKALNETLQQFEKEEYCEEYPWRSFKCNGSRSLIRDKKFIFYPYQVLFILLVFLNLKLFK